LIALIQSYAGIVRPDTVVAKSGALKHFARCCSPWQATTPARQHRADHIGHRG